MAEDSTLVGIFSEFTGSLDKCTEALENAAKAFRGGPSTGNSPITSGRKPSRNSGRSSDDILKDAEKMFDRSSKNTNQALTMGQKFGKTFITSLEAIGKVLIKEFTDSINRVSSDYLSNLSSITARMQISNHEYAGLYNEYASKISREFKGAFSVKDFSSSLVTALDTGLRGSQAKDIAYRNMITNKLVPAISTNTQAYRRMSVTLGDSFNKSITAMAKYAESIDAATGIEEGKLNANIETFEKEFMYTASEKGLSKDQASQLFAQYQLALAKTTSVYGEETTQYIVDQLKGNANNIIGSGDVSSILNGTFLPEQAMEAMFQPTGSIGKILTNLEKLSNENVNTQSVLADKLGYSIDAIHQVGIQKNWGVTANEFGKDLMKDLKDFDPNSIYNNETSKLTNNYYTSADDYFSNQIDNATTFLATAKSNIKRFDTMIGLLTTIAGAVVGNFVFTKTIGSQGGSKLGSKLFSSLGNSSGGQSGILGKLASKGYQIAPAEGVTSLSGIDAAAKGLTGSTTATAAGVGLGIGGIVAGGALMLKNGISTGIANKNIGAGIVGTFAGDSNIGLSEAEKIAKGQDAANSAWVGKSGIDWRKVGKNAGTGALLGAGIGTAVGGWAVGSGTVVGGLIGAAGGALTSVVQQLADSAYYAKLAKQSKAYSESLTKLQDSATKYEAAKKKEISITEILSKGVDNFTDNDLAAMREAYPDLFKNVTDVSELDESYVRILEAKIEAEKRDSADEVIDNFKENIKDAKKVLKTESKKSIGNIGAAEFEVAQAINDSDSGNITTKQLSNIAKKYGMKTETLKNELAGWVTIDEESDTVKLYNGEDTFNAMKGKYNKYNTSEKGSSALTIINKNLDELRGLSNQLASVWEYNKENDYWEFQGSFDNEKAFDKDWERYKDFAKQIKSDINNMTGDYNTVALKSWDKIKPTLFGFDKKITPDDYRRPGFKVGNRNLSEDGLFYGHKREMVLTSANADKLRSLESSGGISGILSGLLGITKLRATPIDTPTSIDPVSTAIAQQTETLSKILDNILAAVLNLNPNERSKTSNSVKTSNDLFTYEGA